MRLDIYLKRQRTSLANIINLIGAESYEDLARHFKSIGIKCPPEEEIDYEFKKNVEERAVVKSNSKKRRVSNQKSEKSKSTNSTSSRGSKPTQRVRKGSTKRQRKRNSDKVESVQPASGSEDTK
jgi:hypothetical protein